MPRDPVKNRANTARTRMRRKARALTIITELCKYVHPEPIEDDYGQVKGYAYRVRVPDEFYQRFEEIAREHGRTAQQLCDETMKVYLEEVARLGHERN